MTTIRSFYYCLILTIILTACEVPEEKMNYLEKTSDGVTIKASLAPDEKSQKIRLTYTIDNSSDQNVIVNYASAQISTSEAYRTDPNLIEKFERVILPGKHRTYAYVYEPLNNPDLFNITDYKGDLKPQYNLLLDFITNENNNRIFHDDLKFQIPNDIYENHIKIYGRENHMHLFALVEKEKFISKQKGYLKKIHKSDLGTSFSNINRRQHNNERPASSEYNYSVNLTDHEIVSEGTAIRIALYQLKDSLRLNIRIVNHGNYNLNVAPGKFTISTLPGSQILFPDSANFKEIRNKFDSMTDSYLLPKGGRFKHELKYKLYESCNAASVSLDAITIAEPGKNKLFATPLSFKYPAVEVSTTQISNSNEKSY